MVEEAHQDAVLANGLGLPNFEDEEDPDELLSDEDAPDLQDEIAKTLTSLKVQALLIWPVLASQYFAFKGSIFCPNPSVLPTSYSPLPKSAESLYPVSGIQIESIYGRARAESIGILK